MQTPYPPYRHTEEKVAYCYRTEMMTLFSCHIHCEQLFPTRADKRGPIDRDKHTMAERTIDIHGCRIPLPAAAGAAIHTPPSQVYRLLPHALDGFDRDAAHLLHCATFACFSHRTRSPAAVHGHLRYWLAENNAHLDDRQVWNIWNTLAERAGFVSLEVYLMLHTGYQASTWLPPDFRRHAIAHAAWLEMNHTAELINDPLPDHFPELDIHPADPPDRILAAFETFLDRYRLADIVFEDGGRDLIHCGFSAVRVKHLLAAKHFPASRAVTLRFASGDAAFDAAFGTALEQATRPYGYAPKELWGALRVVTTGSRWPSAAARAEHAAHWRANPELSTRQDVALQILSTLPADVVATIENNPLTPHEVATVRIGSTDYLVDINGIQFGPMYDRAALLPVADAAAHGYLLPTLPEMPDWQRFARESCWEIADLVRTTHYCAQQEAMAEYLRIA